MNLYEATGEGCMVVVGVKALASAIAGGAASTSVPAVDFVMLQSGDVYDACAKFLYFCSNSRLPEDSVWLLSYEALIS